MMSVRPQRKNGHISMIPRTKAMASNDGAYILRREGVGEWACKGISAGAGGMKIVNASKEETPMDAKYCFRWGSTNSINGSPKVLNTAKAIHRVYEKKAFRLELNKEGLCPKTWGSLKDWAATGQHYPIMIRKSPHQRSEGMWVANNLTELFEAVENVTASGDDYYLSSFIAKAQEFRVFVMFGRIAWIIEKKPKSKDEMSWGCVEEGNFNYVKWSMWPEAVVRNAILSFGKSGLDFGAVDVIVDGEGNAYTVEINTAAQLTPYYAETIGKVFAYVVKNGPEHEPPLTDYSSFHKTIHPAVKDY